MSTDLPSLLQSEPKTCCQAVLGSPLMCDDSSEKGVERLEVVSTTNPPGTSTNVPGSTNQDTGDMACNKTTEADSQRNVVKKKGFQSFFRNPWKAIKSFHRRNKVEPYQNPADQKLVPAPPNPKVASQSHVADPEPLSGPSNFKAADEPHLANPGPQSGPSNRMAADEPRLANPGPQSGPSIRMAADEPHLANPGPQSGPSNRMAADKPHLANPGPLSGPSKLKAADETHLANPGPQSGPSNHNCYLKQLKLSVTEEKGGDGIFGFFWRQWKAFKCIFSGKKGLFDLYEVGELISAGASGTVYEGTRKSDGLKVAIKCVHCTPLSGEDMEPEVYVNLLLKEPPLCPNIVQMFDWFQEPERYLMVMEYPYPCVTLDTFIRRSGGALSEPVARGIMLQLIEAVNFCMNRGIVHYDLHFRNVLVNTDTMQIKLIDFGLASVLSTTACDPSRRFMSESPPELRFENFYISRWTTVYILGRALQLMIHGYFELRPNLSKEIGNLIDWCKQRSKENRPTLEEMLQHDWFTKEKLTYNQKH